MRSQHTFTQALIFLVMSMLLYDRGSFGLSLIAAIWGAIGVVAAFVTLGEDKQWLAAFQAWLRAQERRS